MQGEGAPQPFVLRQKLEDFAAWFFPVVDRFPKAEKWALCTQIKNCVYTLMRHTIRLQKSRDKLRWLFELDYDLEMLRFLVRHAHTSRYLSNRRLRLVTERLAEIGKIIGAMIQKRREGAQP